MKSIILTNTTTSASPTYASPRSTTGDRPPHAPRTRIGRPTSHPATTAAPTPSEANIGNNDVTHKEARNSVRVLSDVNGKVLTRRKLN